MIRRAEIYWAERSDRKPRPVVVVSPGFLNDVRNRVLAAPCTSKRVEEVTHTEVRLNSESLPKPTKVQCQDVASLRITVLTGRIRPLTDQEVESFDRAITIAVGLM